ncbi:hypothetical protein V502_06191 [Pseudogymnoascus sp. VKM F-4520 (FW-2644)]|nr:hypothetical protein V502_06191 [Pseudogymnoascus sp. VKM F-4520 (FW-2644)]
MSSSDEDASDSDPAVVFNPPLRFADFHYESELGFQYTKESFQRQLAAKDNKSEKYQQKEAFPRPDGVSHDDWKKVFNSADSLVYKKFNGKSALSLQERQRTHNTREEAEKKLKERLLASGRALPGPDLPQGHPQAGSSSSGNNSNFNPRQQPLSAYSRPPAQLRPASLKPARKPARKPAASRKRSSRKKNSKKTSTQQPPSSSSRGNNPPRTFQTPSGLILPIPDYFDPLNGDYQNAHNQPSSSSKDKPKIVHKKPSYHPGEYNQAYRADPTSHGPYFNNLWNGHRDGSTNTPQSSRPTVASNSLYTGPGVNPINTTGLPPFTVNSVYGAQFDSESLGNNPNTGLGVDLSNYPEQSSVTHDPVNGSHSDFESHTNALYPAGLYPGFTDYPSYEPGQSPITDDPIHEPQRWDANYSNTAFGEDSTNPPGRPSFANNQFYEPQSSRLALDDQTYRSQLSSQAFVQSNTYTGLGEYPSNHPGPSSPKDDNTDSLTGMQKPPSPKIDPKIPPKQSSFKDNSKIGAQISPSPTKNSSNAYGQASSKVNSKTAAPQPSSSNVFQAPRGSVFFQGSYFAPPNNNFNNAHNQSLPSSPPKDNSKIGAQQSLSAKKNKKIANKQSSPPAKDNSKTGAQQPPSKNKNNKKIAHKQSSSLPSKDNSKIGAQPSSSSKNNSKNNSKLGTKRPFSSINSEIAVQPSSSKAKVDRPQKNMSSQAKKQKGKADYCVCKQVKHGTKMIACEGGCENWFHVSCLELACDDTDGVAKFICDDCVGSTTYKRVCRLEGCNRPHSTREVVGEDGKSRMVPSKYCSLEHRNAFWAGTVGKMDPLLTSELRSFMAQTSLGDFQTAGDQPSRAVLGAQHGSSGLPDGFVATGPPHNEEGMFSLDINQRNSCHKAIARLEADMLHYENRAKLVAMVKEYSDKTTKKYAEENKIVESAPKRAKDKKSGKNVAHTICGYDPRVVVSDRWIDRYMATPEGDAAWKSGVIGEHTNPDFHVDVDPEYYKGVCVRIKCQGHNEWYKLRKEETDENLLWRAEDLKEEKKKLDEMVKRVQLRLAIQREREQYAQKRAAEMTGEKAAEFLRSWGTMKGDKDLILRRLLDKFHPAPTRV